MVEQSTSELLVLGAGVIGLSCAWRAAQQGRRVAVLDPAPASGASWVAGGMLAPVTEAWPGEEELLALGVEAVAQYAEDGTVPQPTDGLDFFDTGVTLVTDQPVEGLESEDSAWGSENCWG